MSADISLLMLTFIWAIIHDGLVPHHRRFIPESIYDDEYDIKGERL